MRYFLLGKVVDESSRDVACFRPLNWHSKTCMRLHNMIVTHRPSTSSIDAIDREVFDDECRRFFPENNSVEGVHGGEADVQLDSEGNPSHGGRPPRLDVELAALGKNSRDEHRDEIARQGLVRPRTNWFRDCNRLIDNNN